MIFKIYCQLTILHLVYVKCNCITWSQLKKIIIAFIFNLLAFIVLFRKNSLRDLWKLWWIYLFFILLKMLKILGWPGRSKEKNLLSGSRLGNLGHQCIQGALSFLALTKMNEILDELIWIKYFSSLAMFYSSRDAIF